MIYRSRSPQAKWSLVDCLMVSVAFALIAACIYLLPSAMETEADMASASVKSLQSPN